MKYTNQQKHEEVMNAFLSFLYKQTDRFIFKGGTALCKYYGLDRFSEDLDFDSEKGNIGSIVKKFCQLNKFPIPKERKDTNYGQKFFIDYGVPGQSLKVETSLRNKHIDKSFIRQIDGVYVYDINRITILKMNAYLSRDKIRDLYDLAFIVNKHYDKLNEITKKDIKDAFLSKGLEQYDYVARDQKDEFIDPKKLEDAILKSFEKLGLLQN
jgi:predicted nucleotidyltransferase component of viral defense system